MNAIEARQFRANAIAAAVSGAGRLMEVTIMPALIDAAKAAKNRVGLHRNITNDGATQAAIAHLLKCLGYDLIEPDSNGPDDGIFLIVLMPT